MQVPFLDLKRQRSQVYTAAIERVLERGWFIQGVELQAFEASFAGYCGTRECIGVANGTDALELALRAAGVATGDEVATVANAGMYATTAIRALGAIPLFVDIDPRNLLMDPDSLRAALGTATRAIVVTHLYGLLAPMPAIIEIARERSIPVIEDCAQAHGATRDGLKAGAWGLAGCFSFYPTKNLGAVGDAGAVVTSDPGLAERVRSLRQYGWNTRFHSSLPGGCNSRLDEVQAAVLVAKLPLLDGWNQRRREIAARYSEALVGREPRPQSQLQPHADFAAHLYVVRSSFRDQLQAYLKSCGVESVVYYPVPDHLQPSQVDLTFRKVALAHTEKAAGEVLALPCYPELADEEIECVIRSLMEFRHDR